MNTMAKQSTITHTDTDIIAAITFKTPPTTPNTDSDRSIDNIIVNRHRISPPLFESRGVHPVASIPNVDDIIDLFEKSVAVDDSPPKEDGDDDSPKTSFLSSWCCCTDAGDDATSPTDEEVAVYTAAEDGFESEGRDDDEAGDDIAPKLAINLAFRPIRLAARSRARVGVYNPIEIHLIGPTHSANSEGGPPMIPTEFPSHRSRRYTPPPRFNMYRGA